MSRRVVSVTKRCEFSGSLLIVGEEILMFTCTCFVISLSIMVYSLIFQVLPPILNKQTLLNVPFPAACVDLCASHSSAGLSSPYSLIIQTTFTDLVPALSFRKFKLTYISAVCLIVSFASSVSFIIELMWCRIIFLLIFLISFLLV